MKPLSERELLCLDYLAQLMWTDAFAVGRYVRANCLDPAKGGSNLSCIGAALLGRLRKIGLVTFLPDIKAWRLTAAGRKYLADESLSPNPKPAHPVQGDGIDNG